jgi:hypothetical protein
MGDGFWRAGKTASISDSISISNSRGYSQNLKLKLKLNLKPFISPAEPLTLGR